MKNALDRLLTIADLLNRIQIGQPSAIEDQVVFPANPGNSVDWEADELIDGNRSVEQKREAHKRK